MRMASSIALSRQFSGLAQLRRSRRGCWSALRSCQCWGSVGLILRSRSSASIGFVAIPMSLSPAPGRPALQRCSDRKAESAARPGRPCRAGRAPQEPVAFSTRIARVDQRNSTAVVDGFFWARLAGAARRRQPATIASLSPSPRSRRSSAIPLYVSVRHPAKPETDHQESRWKTGQDSDRNTPGVSVQSRSRVAHPGSCAQFAGH